MLNKKNKFQRIMVLIATALLAAVLIFGCWPFETKPGRQLLKKGLGPVFKAQVGLALVSLVMAETDMPREPEIDWKTKTGRTWIFNPDSAPYPYAGKYADTEDDFFDYKDPETGELFHTTRYEKRFPRSQHYMDSSVLVRIPPQFNPNEPFYLVVFFHGHQTDVNRTLKEFRLETQVDQSRSNVILVCPQLAKDALDSSPGKLFEKGKFKILMDDVADWLAVELGSKYRTAFDQAPIILAAFSGGYKAVAYVLDRGGENGRIKGVFLMDALFEDEDKIGQWFLDYRKKGVFLLSLYTKATKLYNENMEKMFDKQKAGPGHKWPGRIEKGHAYLVSIPDADHHKIPLDGPPREPLARMLKILP